MTEAEFKQITTWAKKTKTVKGLMKQIATLVQTPLINKAYSHRTNAVKPTKSSEPETKLKNDQKLGIKVRTEADSAQWDAVRKNLPRSPYAAKTV